MQNLLNRTLRKQLQSSRQGFSFARAATKGGCEWRGRDKSALEQRGVTDCPDVGNKERLALRKRVAHASIHWGHLIAPIETILEPAVAFRFKNTACAEFDHIRARARHRQLVRAAINPRGRLIMRSNLRFSSSLPPCARKWASTYSYTEKKDWLN